MERCGVIIKDAERIYGKFHILLGCASHRKVSLIITEHRASLFSTPKLLLILRCRGFIEAKPEWKSFFKVSTHNLPADCSAVRDVKS